MATVKEALLAYTIFGVRRLRDERNITAAQWRAAHHCLSVAYVMESVATDQLVEFAKDFMTFRQRQSTSYTSVDGVFPSVVSPW